MLEASRVRARLRFDVERLREAALRLVRVDHGLSELRRHLQARAQLLAREAHGVRSAQALASANLARRVSLADVVRSAHDRGSLALIAGMAVSRWIAALVGFNERVHGESAVRAQIEAGRIAYRLLVALRKKRGLTSGLGQLTAAVVVAELAHPEDRPYVDDQIDEGLFRGLRAAGIHSEADALSGASLALREAAVLLERLAGPAEGALADLLEEADGLENKVAQDLGRSQSGSARRGD